MPITVPAVEQLKLTITQEIIVNAPLDVTFEAVLEQMGPANETPDGRPLQMRLEAWPGGRWFRDLGDGNGHLWGFVQAIKRPTLLEITGPLFMSSAAINNVQYRLKEDSRGTVIAFRHTGFGLGPEDHAMGFAEGWVPLFERIRRQAEAGRRH